METVTERKYRLFIPQTDDGKEAVVTGGEVRIEIADVVGTKLVRTQRRVTVESLVRAHFPEDSLSGRSRGMVRPDQKECTDSLPCHTSQAPTESASHSAGSERSSTP